MANKRKWKSMQAYDASIRPLKKYTPTSPLPSGVHHYQELEEVPWDIQKYVEVGWTYGVG
jgi:hypothetical protein